MSLANFRLLFNLLLIRSPTARGSGTSVLPRWSLQKLTAKAILFTLENIDQRNSCYFMCWVYYSSFMK